MDTLGVIILAAGNSVRMGQIKALLNYQSQVSFLEQIYQAYKQAGITKSLVVVNTQNYHAIKQYVDNAKLNLPFAINPKKNSSRIESIKVGLAAIKNCTGVFIHDVDRPFIAPNLLSAMKMNLQNNNYVVPAFQSRTGHPVLIGKKLIQQLLIEAPCSHTLKDFLAKYEQVSCEWGDNTIFLNINTTDQLKEIHMHNNL